MLWKAPDQVADMLTGPDRHRIVNEIADVLIYALLAAHEAGVSPSEAIRQKLTENAIKYPVGKSRGTAAKYNELPK
jgi:phosphoribosyl-ATP pyrophosphohydrolase